MAAADGGDGVVRLSAALAFCEYGVDLCNLFRTEEESGRGRPIAGLALIAPSAPDIRGLERTLCGDMACAHDQSPFCSHGRRLGGFVAIEEDVRGVA